MANIVFNIAKGRVAELANRVKSNDPAAAGLVVLLLANTGLESDATLIDKDTVQDLVAGATNEATNTGYARKTISDADTLTYAPDDGSDWTIVDIADQTWTGVANDGTGAIAKLVIAYDPALGSGTDADLVPLTMHDFAVTPDGSDITATIAGFYKAS